MFLHHFIHDPNSPRLEHMVSYIAFLTLNLERECDIPNGRLFSRQKLLTLMLQWWLFWPIQMMQKKTKLIETMAPGYSSASTQRELSHEYQHDRIWIVIKDMCVLARWTKVASTSEGNNCSLKLGAHRGWSEYVFRRNWKISLRVHFAEKKYFLKPMNQT